MATFRLLVPRRISICPPKVCYSTYVQGQSPQPNIREYFYYIDHQGMLFLDDARMKNFTSCFKGPIDVRLRKNETGRYVEFAFLSLCGRERNYVKCDDRPIVFTHVLNIDGQDLLSYNHAGDLLSVAFEPDKIYMNPNNGRIYHPAPARGDHIGLIASKLAIEFSKNFTYDDSDTPSHFTWKNSRFKLSSKWFTELTERSNQPNS